MCDFFSFPFCKWIPFISLWWWWRWWYWCYGCSICYYKLLLLLRKAWKSFATIVAEREKNKSNLANWSATHLQFDAFQLHVYSFFYELHTVSAFRFPLIYLFVSKNLNSKWNLLQECYLLFGMSKIVNYFIIARARAHMQCA